jgi:hypothetical protein
MQLLHVASARAAAAGAKQKSEVLYEYVSSTEFRHRVESIVEAFVAMEAGLQEEKRATQRQCGFRRRRPAIPIEGGQCFRSIADSIPMIADRRSR